MTSPRKSAASSRGRARGLNVNSSGVVSISVVVARPLRNVALCNDVLEERDVRLDAADAELAQRAVHALRARSSNVWPLTP